MTINTHLSRSALLALAVWLSTGLYQLRIIPLAGAEESPTSTLTDGLVGYWALDDGMGFVASDRSGYGNHGILSSPSILLWQPSGGKINGALLFDGNGGYVNCGNDPDFNLSNGLTVTAWIKVNAFNKDWQAIVTKGDSAWRLHRYSNTNYLDFACTGLTGGDKPWGSTVWGSKSVNDGQWHHVAGVYDYSASRVYLYVDGFLDGPNSVRVGSGGIATNTFDVRIGENAERTWRYWNGLIDDVRIYPIALTATQILSLANLKPPSGVSMVAYWRLDESGGTTTPVLDSSGNSHHGTLRMGTSPTWEAGKIDGSLFFHGSPDHVNCGNNPIFNITDQLTVAAWVNIATVPSDWTGIITKGDDAWRLSTVTNQRKFHFAVTGAPNYWSINGNTEIPPGEWHHVCGTYDGAFIRLYIDGMEDPASPVAYTGPIAATAHNVWLGGNSDRQGREFHGFIDEAAVWNRALSPEEIGWLVNDGVGNPVWTPTDTYVDDDAPGDPAPGNPDISDPYENGTWEHPFDAIQEAIDMVAPGTTVTVLDGIYTGAGNRDINFHGKPITLRSRNGPANCIIDCQQLGTGFEFSSEEWTDSVVDGFTIINGYYEDQGKGGGGIYCCASSPTITNCIITANKAWRGGAIFCYFANPTITNCTITNNESLYEEGGGICCWYGSPTITNCTISRNTSAYSAAGLGFYSDGEGYYLTIDNCMISHNSPDAIRIDNGTARIFGTVQVASGGLIGNGYLEITQGATLETSDCNLSCSIVGIGTILVPAGREFVIENEAVVGLSGDGMLQCNGLLRVKDNGNLLYTNLNVARASFENNAVVAYNTITTSVLAPYGQLLAKDMASIIGNDIRAAGDRYIDIDPSTFGGMIQGNSISVTITEGTGKIPAGLFELRGYDINCPSPPCPPGIFHLSDVPDFNLSTWTIDRMELVEGAKVTLTNRVDFQTPYDEGGQYEVAYVKNLVLGPNSVLDTAFNRLYYGTLEKHPTAQVAKNTSLLGFSLGKIDFDDSEEFATRISHNNFIDIDPAPPDTTRIHVERVLGLPPDPTGMMLMQNLRDIDPASPTYGDIISTRAKALFAKCTEEKIMIRFKYLFNTAPAEGEFDLGTELVVYLSDVPELLDPNDPMRDYHYIEVGRIPVPPPGRPGSPGSGRFGVFQKTVSTEDLNFSEGTRIEVELFEPQQAGFRSLSAIDTRPKSAPSPAGASAFLDAWSAEVHCSGICLDLTGDNYVDEIDFMTVICACGCASGLLPGGTGSYVCFEGPFDTDGYIDSYDTSGWDWTLNSDNRKNLCDGIPLSEGMKAAGLEAGNLNASGDIAPLGNPPGNFNDLLIAGKMGTTDRSTKLKDRLYVFDSNALYVRSLSPATDRCNIKIAQDPNGQLYQINYEKGVRQLDTLNTIIIPRGQTTYAKEPRYNKSATVYVGIKGEGSNAVGRSILDAAFDANGYIYVVPVVVNPDGNEPYAAAAKLQLSSGSPPYTVVKLYDDPPLPGDNQYRNNLREIEIDSAGNLYVLNAHSLNESDVLFRYKPNGTIERIELAKPDVNLPDPIGMYMSDATDMLYLSSAQYNPQDSKSSIVYGFSTKPNLTLTRSITINNMHIATSITEDPATGSLWVVGFNMDNIPQYPDPTKLPFYYPRLAKVPLDSNNVQAQSLAGSHDLAMPLSVLWTKTLKCGGADLNKSNKVDFVDFAIFRGRWRNSNCAPPTWCAGADLNNSKTVELTDLAVLAEHWLQTGCQEN